MRSRQSLEKGSVTETNGNRRSLRRTLKRKVSQPDSLSCDDSPPINIEPSLPLGTEDLLKEPSASWQYEHPTLQEGDSLSSASSSNSSACTYSGSVDESGAVLGSPPLPNKSNDVDDSSDALETPMTAHKEKQINYWKHRALQAESMLKRSNDVNCRIQNCMIDVICWAYSDPNKVKTADDAIMVFYAIGKSWRGRQDKRKREKKR